MESQNILQILALNYLKSSMDQLRQKIHNILPQSCTQNQISLFVKKDQQRERDNKLARLWKILREQQSDNEFLLQLIDKQFRKRLRTTFLIEQVISKRINSLKFIHIEYVQPIINQEGQERYRYSISAFDLFKIIHQNKQLKQVTIKGVYISNFQQCVQQIVKGKQERYLMENIGEQDWINNFNPSKSLKLNIVASVAFYVQLTEQTNTLLQNLVSFGKMFFCMSDICVHIFLGQFSLLNDWSQSLQHVLRGVQSIKKIKIKIQQRQQYTIPVSAESVAGVRQALFGKLASFTEIEHLSFKGIHFDTSVNVNDFLAIESILGQIFNNNKIISLQITYCENLPVFPQITTLEQINLQSVSFRKKFNFLSNLSQTNPLRSIRCSRMQSKWNIEERLFNQLQILIIIECKNISFSEFITKSPSKIKHLSIQRSINSGLLTILLPKLHSLTFLNLNYLGFDTQLILTIPSTQLQELHLGFNNKISQQGLNEVDKKWPRLKYLGILYLENIGIDFWSQNSFKNLIRLTVDVDMFYEIKDQWQPKMKGTIFSYYDSQEHLLK